MSGLPAMPLAGLVARAGHGCGVSAHAGRTTPIVMIVRTSTPGAKAVAKTEVGCNSVTRNPNKPNRNLESRSAECLEVRLSETWVLGRADLIRFKSGLVMPALED